MANINSTVQCSNNRAGILCGRCRPGYSLILGGSGCRKDCTNFSLLLLVFFLAGFLLVFFITFLNLTVSRGTINGLVFYANIVHIYGFFIFRNNDKLLISFLRVFIAWLNLDLGVKSCFFKGMGGFTKALLQFVFPL